MPSHRALAMFRGRNEGVLDLDLDVPDEAASRIRQKREDCAMAFGIADRGRPADKMADRDRALAWKARLQLLMPTCSRGSWSAPKPRRFGVLPRT